MAFWGKRKTRNKLDKTDIESVNNALEYINHTAISVANMAAKYKKRYLLEGHEGDNDFMAICDSTTAQLKESYEVLYQIVEAKQEELSKK
tara:strand:- start:576 stop:845 length:270 start_codon:yes stop_codon:yes gene_type:complete